ncbi:hypothetical protein [Paenibacillus chitinolyticus]|uniref:Uncharacterized protein n=1 Tax=Paenibacillus chitinolyticus TaxID=79263 RepID=A0ABT4FF90_9BACL|nr:hypothetical protein [Paenibacillus chitinolyticus]MCY9593398.1 hypothetical protein [Paenibacillus chitinolyticus]MCY9597086.1 hypothetical protein [Paenibacillus chitinolyticus]
MEKLAREVIVVHRRSEFTAHEQPVAQMRSFAKVMTPYTISSLHGTADRIERVMLAHAGTGASDVTEVDEVVVSHGYDRDSGNLVKLGTGTCRVRNHRRCENADEPAGHLRRG